jgi:hypothetical protein
MNLTSLLVKCRKIAGIVVWLEYRKYKKLCLDPMRLCIEKRLESVKILWDLGI